MPRLVAIWMIAFCTFGVMATYAQRLPPQRVSLGMNGGDPNSLSLEPVLSEDGRFVAFQSFATNLVAGDTNLCSDVFVRDRTTGETTRVSVSSAGAQANYYSGEPAISPDGRFVAFVSDATNLVPGDTNGVADVFVHDLKTRRTQRVSISSAGFESNAPSGRPALSRDARYIAFASEASNLVSDDKNGVQDVFVRERLEGPTIRITMAGRDPDAASYAPSISGDGRQVAFVSRASFSGDGVNRGSTLTGGARFEPNVFLFDARARKVSLVSANPSGAPAGGEAPAISRDGSVVVFESGGRLVPADVNPSRDVYAYRVASRELGLASVSSDGACGRAWSSFSSPGVLQLMPADSTGPSVSADGRFVVFVSLAFGLVPGVTGGAEVYLRDLETSTTRCLSAGNAKGSSSPPCALDPVLGVVDCPTVRAFISGNATTVGFQTRGRFDAGDSNRCEDIYVVAPPSPR